jgi:hypothetical protein
LIFLIILLLRRLFLNTVCYRSDRDNCILEKFHQCDKEQG